MSSNTLKSALAGGLTAILLYMVLPSKVEVERVREELRPITIPEIKIPEIRLPELVKVKFTPYEKIGFMRYLARGKDTKPLSITPRSIDGLGILYPVKTYYDNVLVDQSDLDPIEVCSSTECGITLSPSMALMFNVDNLNKVYIRNRSDNNVILEVIYYEV